MRVVLCCALLLLAMTLVSGNHDSSSLRLVGEQASVSFKDGNGPDLLLQREPGNVLSVGADLNINGELEVAGTLWVANETFVLGNFSSNGPVIANGDVTVEGKLSYSGNGEYYDDVLDAISNVRISLEEARGEFRRRFAPEWVNTGDVNAGKQDGFKAINLTEIHPHLTGFKGGFCLDYQYCWLVPEKHELLARLDVRQYFGSKAAIEYMNLTESGHFADMSGYHTGYASYSYGYLCPNVRDGGGNGRFTRFSLWSMSANDVDVVDLTTLDSRYVGYESGFFYYPHAYLIPHKNGPSSPNPFLIRVNEFDFAVTGTDVLDLSLVDPRLAQFRGGVLYNENAYLIPAGNDSVASGWVVKVYLPGFTTSDVYYFNMAKGATPNFAGFAFGFEHYGFLYFIPHRLAGSPHSELVRLDLQDFNNTGLSFINISDAYAPLRGFSGGFKSEGGMGYLVSMYGANNGGYVVRVDLNEFSASRGVVYYDLTSLHPDYQSLDQGFYMVDGGFGFALVEDTGILVRWNAC